MLHRSKWPCWEIIKCDDGNKCIVKEQTNKMCWEIIEERDCRSFHICSDCLVYVSHQKNSPLKRKELLSIMAQKGLNILEDRHSCKCTSFGNLAER